MDILYTVFLVNDGSYGLLDGVIFLVEHTSEKLTLYSNFEGLRNLINKCIEFFLLGHSALNSQEIAPNLQLKF